MCAHRHIRHPDTSRPRQNNFRVEILGEGEGRDYNIGIGRTEPLMMNYWELRQSTSSTLQQARTQTFNRELVIWLAHLAGPHFCEFYLLQLNQVLSGTDREKSLGQPAGGKETGTNTQRILSFRHLHTGGVV